MVWIEEVGPAVVGGVDAVHARDPAVVARDVDPEVARDGEHGHRLGGGVEAGHHRHVAALAAGVGLVAEGLDLGGVGDEGARVRADQEQVEGLARAAGAADQVLGVDLLDLVEAVVGVDVEAADPDGGEQDDEGERVEGPPPPAVLALAAPSCWDLRSSAWRSARDLACVLGGVGRPGGFGFVGGQESENTWPGGPVAFAGAF